MSDSVSKADAARLDKERFDRGLATRREVLGAAYVDKAVASADVTAGEFVTANSTGQVTNINSTAGSTIVGQALEASAVAGSIISVRLGVGVQ